MSGDAKTETNRQHAPHETRAPKLQLLIASLWHGINQQANSAHCFLSIHDEIGSSVRRGMQVDNQFTDARILCGKKKSRTEAEQRRFWTRRWLESTSTGAYAVDREKRRSASGDCGARWSRRAARRSGQNR